MTAKEVSKLRQYLRYPRTARQVAELFECSKPTAYNRINTFKVKRSKVREAKRGPMSVAYSLA